MIVFDLDNTLRSVSSAVHKTPSDDTRPENWVNWQKHVNEHGTPINDSVALYHHLYEHNDILIVTGSQFGTVDWLERHDISIPDGVVERDKHDDRTSEEYKKQWIAENLTDIDLWIDDDEVICEHTREMGIPTIQVGK